MAAVNRTWGEERIAAELRLKLGIRVSLIEETPAYWRVVFDNPPLNIMDADMFEGLQGLLGQWTPARAFVSSSMTLADAVAEPLHRELASV